MPLGEIAGELTGSVFRFIGHFLVEVVLEFAVKGLGYLVCRLFSRSVDPDGAVVILVGVTAWVALITLGVAGYSWVQDYLAVDSCLDAGGQFNYEANKCVGAQSNP